MNVQKKSSTSKQPTSGKKTATKPLRPAQRKLPKAKKSKDLLSPKDAGKSHDDPFDDPEQLYKVSNDNVNQIWIFAKRIATDGPTSLQAQISTCRDS